jgi:hypothetical protein
MLRRLAILGLSLWLIVTALPGSAETLTGRVVAVAEGDTLTVLKFLRDVAGRTPGALARPAP